MKKVLLLVCTLFGFMSFNAQSCIIIPVGEEIGQVKNEITQIQILNTETKQVISFENISLTNAVRILPSGHYKITTISNNIKESFEISK